MVAFRETLEVRPHYRGSPLGASPAVLCGALLTSAPQGSDMQLWAAHTLACCICHWRAAFAIAIDVVFVTMIHWTSIGAACANCHNCGECLAGIEFSSTL
jgi:hypothetical protein